MPFLSEAERLARYNARRTGPLRDVFDIPLAVGQWVRPAGRWREDKVDAWPIWQVKQSKPGRLSVAGKLKVVAYGGTKWLPITRERSLNLIVFTPSLFLDLLDYPEEWAWWRASGWQMWAEDGTDGCVHLYTTQDRNNGGKSWGAAATLKELATAELTHRFLTEALFLHLHPTKSRRLYESTGEVCTEQDLAAFIRAQRRKVGKPPS